MSNDEILYDTPTLAIKLKVSVWQVKAWRREGGGPKWVPVGKRGVRYRPEDVEEWKASLPSFANSAEGRRGAQCAV